MAKFNYGSKKISYTIDFDVNKQALEDVQRNLAALKMSAKTAGQDSINKELKESVAVANQLSDILAKAWNPRLGSLNLGKLNQELKSAGLSASVLKTELGKGGKDGAAAYNELARTILNTNIQLKQSNDWLDKMATTFKNTIRYGFSSSVFNRATGAIEKAWSYTKNLDKSLNDIRIVTDKSAESMANFAKHANKAAQSLGKSTKDYTDAALIYYQQGDSDAVAKAKAETTLKTANVTGQSTAEVSEQLTAVWNGYKVSASEAELYIDKLAAVAAATAADLEELSTGMSKVASAANLMGVDIDQLNAQLATVISVTRQAPESVGTAFKTIYARMSNIQAGLDDEVSLDGYTKKMAALGVNVLDSNNRLRDMGDVIEEIGKKWNTMSREQQISLSQVMAGTRQYNNLLSLFDNWDMYTSALETSADAAGTLQHQQEIYMESIEGHLEQLQASWEGLYGEIFNTDEIIPLIDALGDIVQGANEVTAAFGGGAKSLAGFAAMYANVFQKSINKDITRLVSNRNKGIENLDALNLKRDFAGVDPNDFSKVDLDDRQATQQAVDDQIENAKRMAAVSRQLTDEENQKLVTLQNESVELERQANLLEIRSKKEFDNIYSQAVDNGVLSVEDVDSIDKAKASGDLDKLDSALGEIEIAQEGILSNLNDEIQSLENQLKPLKLTDEAYKDILQTIREISKQTKSSDTKKELDNAKKKLSLDKTNVKNRQEVLNIAKRVAKEEQQNLNTITKMNKALDKVGKAEEEAYEKRREASGKKQEINETLIPAEKAAKTVGIVNTLTMSASTLATTWSLVNSQFDIWNNKDLSFGEKLLQSITSLTMAAPALISVYKTLRDSSAALAASKYQIAAATQTEVAAEGENIVAKGASVAAEEADIAADTAGAAAEALDTTATEASAVAQTAENVATTEGIALEGANAAASGVDAAAKTAQAGATGAATVAQIGLNAAMLANPVTWLVLGIAALVGGIALFTAASKKAREARIAENDEAYKSAEAAQTEAKAREDLAQKYLDAYDRYKKGTATKQELAEITENLTEYLGAEAVQVAKLTGNYDALTEKMKQYKKEAVKEEVDALKDKVSASGNNMREKAYGSKPASQNNGYLQVSGSGNHGVSYKDEFSDKDFSRYLIDKGLYDYVTDFKRNDDGTISWTQGIQAKDDAKSLAQLREYWDKYKKETNTKGSKYYVSSEEKADSEMYQSYKKFFDAYADDYNNYIASNSELADKQVHLDILNTDFSKIDTSKNQSEAYKDYVEKRKTLLENLKKTGEYAGKTDEEISAIIDSYATKENQGLEDVIKRGVLENPLKEKITGNKTFYNPLSGTDMSMKERYPDFNNELEKAIGDLSNDELKALISSGKDLDALLAQMEGKEAALGGETTSLTDKLHVLADQFGANEINTVELTDAEKELLKTYGYSEDAFLDYVKQIREANKELADNEKQAKEVAMANVRMNKGLETLGDGFDDWNKTIKDAIKNGKELSPEYREAMTDIENALEDVFNVNNVPDDFVKAHLKEIGKLADGDISVLEDLQKDLAKYTFKDIFNVDSIKDLPQEVQNAIAGINALDLDDIKIGTSLDETGLNTALQNMIDNTDIASEDIEKILNQIGFEPDVETKQVPVSSFVENKDTGNYEYEYIDAEGNTRKKTISADTYNSTGVDGFIEIPVINAKTTAFKGANTKGVNFKNTKKGKNKNGGKGKGGGGGSKDPDKIDPLKEEIDRYHDVNIKLKQIDTTLNRIADAQDKAFGGDLIKNYNKEINTLNNQIATTKEKLGIAAGEMKELQDKLKGSGVKFNSDGTIGNYAAALKAQEDYVNGIIKHYNSLGAKAQEKYKDTVEKAKENFEKFKENLERYDTVITEEIPDLQDKIQSAIDKITEDNINKFKMEIDLRLDIAEAERDWNEFKKDVIDQIDDDDILGNAKVKLADLKTYLNDLDNGEVQSLGKHVSETLAELRKFDNGQANVYGRDRKQSLEDLKDYFDKLKDALTEVVEIQKEIQESVIDQMGSVQDKFDKQADTFGMISDLVEHDIKLIQLELGDEAYGQLGAFYDKQQENYNNQLNFQKEQMLFWKQQMENAEAGSEAAEAAQEKWKEATEEWTDLTEKALENVRDKFENTINDLFKKLNDNLTSGKGLGYIKDEWDLLGKNAEQYLDDVNRLQGIADIEKKYQDALDGTDNLSAQRKIKDLMDKELKNLKDADKLSQKDIERAEKKYDLLVAQIALEEAQAQKNRLRLRRDTQGNYRYQYVADEEAVKQAEDKLGAAYNSLYNFDKERYQENLNNAYDTWVEYQEKMAEAAKINDPELRAEKEALIQEQYGELINGIIADNEKIREDLRESAFMDLAHLREEDYQGYLDMTQQEQDLILNGLVPQWQSGVQDMIDTIKADGGFEDATIDTFNKINDAAKDYDDSVKEINQDITQVTGDVLNGEDQIIEKNNEFVASNETVIQTYKDELKAVQDLASEVNNLAKAYEDELKAAKEAHDYLAQENEKAANAAGAEPTGATSATEEKISEPISVAEPVSVTPAPASTSSGPTKQQNRDAAWAVWGGKYGSGATRKKKLAAAGFDPSLIQHMVNITSGYTSSRSKFDKRLAKYGYDTGGYTGEWGNEGRLALLHQKELVLNAKDTEHILDSVKILRSLQDSMWIRFSSITNNIKANGYNGNNSSMLEQNVHIDATFPNVTNALEIENALNNLVNAASQRIGR